MESLAIRPPMDGPVRTFYPDTGEAIPFTRLPDNRLLLTVRDFRVHDMPVVASGNE